MKIVEVENAESMVQSLRVFRQAMEEEKGRRESREGEGGEGQNGRWRWHRAEVCRMREEKDGAAASLPKSPLDWLQVGPGGSQVSSRTSQVGPSWYQVYSKSASGWPQADPRPVKFGQVGTSWSQ